MVSRFTEIGRLLQNWGMSSMQVLFRNLLLFLTIAGLPAFVQGDPDTVVRYQVLLNEDSSVTNGGSDNWESSEFPKFGPDHKGWVVADWSGIENDIPVGGTGLAEVSGLNELTVQFRQKDFGISGLRQSWIFPTSLGVVFAATPDQESWQSIYRGNPPALIEIEGLLEYAGLDGSVLFADRLDSFKTNYSVIPLDGSIFKLGEIDQPITPQHTSTFGEFGKVNMNENGQVTFFAATETEGVPGDNWALFEVSEANELVLTAVEVGKPHPAEPGLSPEGLWLDLERNKAIFGMNGQGVIAFKASITSPPPPNDLSFNPTSIWRKELGQAATVIAVEGTTYTTDVGDVRFDSFADVGAFLNPAVDAEGDVYFHGSGTVAQVNTGEGIWKHDGENISRVVKFDDLPIEVTDTTTDLPYAFGNKNVNVRRVSISKTGRVAIVGDLREGSRSVASVLWAQDQDGDFIVVAVSNFSRDDDNDGERDLFFKGQIVSFGGSPVGNDGRITTLFVPTTDMTIIGGEDRMGQSWWTPREQVMFSTNLNVGEDIKTFVFQAQVGESNLPAEGDTYIWDGGAGTDNWHTITDQKSNWIDSFGARWPTPPGSLGTEEVYIPAGASVKLTQSAATVNSIFMQGGSLEIEQNVTFESLFRVPEGAELILKSGTVSSVAGFLELQAEDGNGKGGKLTKKSDGESVVDVATLQLVDTILSVEGGKLILKNGETQIDNSEVYPAGELLQFEDEKTRFLGESGLVIASAGILQFNSKEVVIETDTTMGAQKEVVDDIDDILNPLKPRTQIIFDGPEGDTIDLKFVGGTAEDPRLLQVFGDGKVIFKRPFTLPATAMIKSDIDDPQATEDAIVGQALGLVVDLAVGSKIDAIGIFENVGQMHINGGGIIGNFTNSKRLGLGGANGSEVILGGFNNGTIEQYADAKYEGILKINSGSVYRMWGATLAPTAPDSDQLIFTTGSDLRGEFLDNSVVFSNFSEGNLSELSSTIAVDGSETTLEISNAPARNTVTAEVMSEDSELIFNNTEFEKLFVKGNGKVTFMGRLKGHLIGGVSNNLRFRDFVTLFEPEPVFEVTTKTYSLNNVTLSGVVAGDFKTIFNFGDYPEQTRAVRRTAADSQGTLDFVAVSEGAVLLNGWSSDMTIESPVILEDFFYNIGHLILKANIENSEPASEDGIFRLGVFPGFGWLEVPSGLDEAIVIETKFQYQRIDTEFKACNTANHVIARDGAQLIIREYSSLVGSSFWLPEGTWDIGKKSSILFMREDEDPHSLKPIEGIPLAGTLIIDEPPEGVPSINGFPNRSVDLNLFGCLTLKDHELVFSSGSLLDVHEQGELFFDPSNDGELDLPSVIADEDGKPIIQGVISLAKAPRIESATRAAETVSGSLPTMSGEVVVVGITNWPGIIRPGNPVGAMLFDGDLNLEPTSQVHLEISGTEAEAMYDQIEVTGTAALGGKLTLYPTEGYEPLENEQFEFVKAMDITGGFVEIDQSRLGRNVRFDFEVGNTGLMATAMPLTIGSYADWRQAFFTGPDAADDLVSGPDQDPDGDGSTNRMEYAFGGNPNVPEGSPVTFDLNETANPDEYAVTATFDWANDVTDSVWFFEVSDDLSDWTEAAATETGRVNNGDFSRITAAWTDPINLTQRIFLRIGVKESL